MSSELKSSSTGDLSAIYSDTERVGSKLNDSDLQIIATRNFFAEKFYINKDIVEFGPGSILGKNKMLDTAKSYTAVELHPATALELKRDLKSRGKVLNENCCQTSLPNDCCDLIIAFAMIYYTDVTELINEASRLLRNDGKLIFCTPNKKQPNFRMAPGSTEYYDPEELVTICAEKGLHVTVHGAYRFKRIEKQNFNLLVRSLYTVSSALLRLLKKSSPGLYLYLRSFKFGKIQKIPEDLSEIKYFEKPTKVQLDIDQQYRMFYFEGDKIA